MKVDFAKFLFPFLVLLGGCSFGPSGATIKLAYGAGYSTGEVTMSQYFFGWLFLLAGVLFYTMVILRRKGAGIKMPTKKTVLGLVLAGILTGMTSFTYILALQTIPASMAVLLLFQFTWIGVIIQAVAERKLPSKRTVIAVVILLLGTVFASGVIGKDVDLDIFGCLVGFSTAVFYAFYMFILGKVGTEMKPINRSFLIITFAVILLTIIFSPSYFTSGVIMNGLWKYGMILGLVGCALPAFLFAVGTPKVPVGAAMILCSSELPASIICAMLILGEDVTILQWVGIVLIFAGIVLSHLGKKTEENTVAAGS